MSKRHSPSVPCSNSSLARSVKKYEEKNDCIYFSAFVRAGMFKVRWCLFREQKVSMCALSFAQAEQILSIYARGVTSFWNGAKRTMKLFCPIYRVYVKILAWMLLTLSIFKKFRASVLKWNENYGMHSGFNDMHWSRITYSDFIATINKVLNFSTK